MTARLMARLSLRKVLRGLPVLQPIRLSSLQLVVDSAGLRWRGTPSSKKHQYLLNHKVGGQGIRVSSFTICMFYPVRIVTWQSECILVTASVTRWL